MHSHLYTEGLTVKSVIPVLNEEFLAKNFRVIEDRLFGMETLKTLIYEQAKSSSALEDRLRGLEERQAKAEGRVSYKFGNLEKMIEREKLESRNFNASTNKAIQQLLSALEELRNHVITNAPVSVPTVQSIIERIPELPLQALVPDPPKSEKHVNDQPFPVEPPATLQQASSPIAQNPPSWLAQPSWDPELSQKVASLEKQLERLDQATHAGLEDTNGKIGGLVCRVGQLEKMLERPYQADERVQRVERVERVEVARTDEAVWVELRSLREQVDRAAQEQSQQRTVLQVVKEEVQKIMFKLLSQRDLEEALQQIQDSMLTKDSLIKVNKDLETLSLRLSQQPTLESILRKLETILEPKLQAYSEQIADPLWQEINSLKDKVGHLSRLADTGVKMKMLRDDLEGKIAEEGRSRAELGRELLARLNIGLQDERVLAERRLAELDDALRKALFNKAESSELEELRRSLYASLSEMTERVNHKFSNKVETKRVLAFHEERLEELFETLAGRREEEQALGARMAGLVRCISCCRELGQATDRIHHPQKPPSRACKRLSLRKLASPPKQ